MEIFCYADTLCFPIMLLIYCRCITTNAIKTQTGKLILTTGDAVYDTVSATFIHFKKAVYVADHVQ